MKTGQILTFYPLSTFEDIDFKITQMGEYWTYIEDISIKYMGGAYMLRMLGREWRGGQE